MKFLKYHISIILPLFLLLFAIESFYILNKIIDNYEKNINNEYSIVAISKVPLDKQDIQNKISIISDFTLLKTDKVLAKINKNIDTESLKKLKESLPLFYSIKLKHLPDQKELDNIRKKIGKITGVSKVVVFKKSYNKFYNFLVFERLLLEFFMIFISVVVLLLIVKQAEVWIFEHKQRFEIMSILGAPFWMKSAMLYRVVIVDAIFSSLLVMSVFIYIFKNKNFLEYFSNLGISFPDVDFIENSAILVGISIVVSLLSVTFAINKMNRE